MVERRITRRISTHQRSQASRALGLCTRTLIRRQMSTLRTRAQDVSPRCGILKLSNTTCSQTQTMRRRRIQRHHHLLRIRTPFTTPRRRATRKKTVVNRACLLCTILWKESTSQLANHHHRLRLVQIQVPPLLQEEKSRRRLLLPLRTRISASSMSTQTSTRWIHAARRAFPSATTRRAETTSLTKAAREMVLRTMRTAPRLSMTTRSCWDLQISRISTTKRSTRFLHPRMLLSSTQ
mmetsp:Transcript_8475/g.22632  ORF Transcript_8475/g.22632 Transcript_8475/m.22632 type:complete len:237 (+) Transcript_8475:377-1087(+)